MSDPKKATLQFVLILTAAVPEDLDRWMYEENVQDVVDQSTAREAIATGLEQAGIDVIGLYSMGSISPYADGDRT